MTNTTCPHCHQVNIDADAECCEASQVVTVKYSDGRCESYESYDAAIASVTEEYPDAEIGHDGDLECGGDRTLCWPDAESAANDDGRRAIATIRR